MDHESEVIKQQMEQTRASLAEKLDTLEEHLASTVRNTTEAVAETVEAVKGAVEGTVNTVTESVETVKETVAETFDFNRQMQERPWLMMGGGVVVGFLGARLLESGLTEMSRQSARMPAPAGAMPAPQGQGNGRSLGLSSDTWSRLGEAFAPALHRLQELALGVGVSTVGRMVLENVPESLRGEVEKVINEVTTAVGGQQVPDYLHQNPAQARASQGPPR
jgi:ElaB/YqjD/DUF883 family membrane-anchored ribosome-binding protein